MNGLRETFDVAKRMAMLVYVAQNVQSSWEFMTFLDQYRTDFGMLEQSILRYRAACQYTPARSKFQTGLVEFKSVTSLNKYVRVAGEMGLVDFEYDASDPKSGIIFPNINSHIVALLSQGGKLPSASKYSFELNPKLKLFMFHILLEKDSLYLLSLIHALHSHSDDLTIVNVRKKILKPFAEALLEALYIAVRHSRQSASSISALYDRIPFIERNVALLRAGKQPKRGLLHLVDPRIHWLYDLKLVDYKHLCKNGQIRPSEFWNIEDSTLKEFILKLSRNPDDVFYSYASRYGAVRKKTELGIVVRELLDVLSEHYTRLIPLDIVVLLSRIALAPEGTRISKDTVVDHLKSQEYVLYRGYDGTIDYVESNHG